MPTTKVKTKSQPVKSSLKSTAKKSNSGFLSNHLQQHFGFDSFKEPQEEIINNLLDGKDNVVRKPDSLFLEAKKIA